MCGIHTCVCSKLAFISMKAFVEIQTIVIMINDDEFCDNSQSTIIPPKVIAADHTHCSQLFEPIN